MIKMVLLYFLLRARCRQTRMSFSSVNFPSTTTTFLSGTEKAPSLSGGKKEKEKEEEEKKEEEVEEKR